VSHTVRVPRTLLSWMTDVRERYLHNVFVSYAIADSGRIVTFFYNIEDKDKVLLQLKSELPGCKERDSHRYTDERHICRLGRFEVQVPNWRKNNAKLPPSQSCSYWCCIHEDIDRSKMDMDLMVS